MVFIIRILLIVGILGGGVYFFFHDSPLLQRHLSAPLKVHGGWPVPYIAVKIIHHGKLGGEEYELSKLITTYEDAILAKFYNSVKGNKKTLSRQEFLNIEKAALSTYWVPGLDKNGDNQVSASEWDAQDAFAVHTLDTDKDQIISIDEYWASISRDRAALFRKADSNRDGNLDIEEYKAVYGGGNAASNFAEALDINNNVFLDPEELRAAKMEQRIPL